MSEPCDTLKKFEPAKLKVTLADGSEVPVAVPRIRNRWSRVQQALDAMSWVRIEALDKNSSVLGVVDNEMAETVDEDEDDDEGYDSGGVNMDRLARVLLEVQRSTMKETRMMFEVQMRGQAELVEALINGVKSISQSYEQSMAVQRASIIAEAAKDGNGNGMPEMMGLIQLALAQSSSKPPMKP